MTSVKRKKEEESIASLLRRREVNKLNSGFLLLGAVFVIMISSAPAFSQHQPTDQTPGVHQTEPTRGMYSSLYEPWDAKVYYIPGSLCIV